MADIRTVFPFFSKITDIYNGVLSSERYAAAGYDSFNVNHSKDEADAEKASRTSEGLIFNILKENELSNLYNFTEKLYKEVGITYKELIEIQEPYFYVRKAKFDWAYESNPNYAKSDCGISFDDVYTLKFIFNKVLDGKFYPAFVESYNEEKEKNESCKALVQSYETILDEFLKKNNKKLCLWYYDRIIKNRAYIYNSCYEMQEEVLKPLVGIVTLSDDPIADLREYQKTNLRKTRDIGFSWF